MVDYAKQVRETIKLIDTFVEKGKFSMEEISFHITRETGFGERFTKNYLQKAIEHGFFFKTKEGIIVTKEDA